MGNKITVVIFIIIVIILLFESCNTQSMTKNWGGSMDVELEPNEKLIECTWKADSLWFLTRDMTEDDVADTYYFRERSSLGFFEGTVTIKEVKLSEEELNLYNAQKKYAEDYYKYSNYDEQSGEPIYINYDISEDIYTVIKPYGYDEYGELIPQ